MVDEVIGDYQTVIKNLGKVFSNAKIFSGANNYAEMEESPLYSM